MTCEKRNRAAGTEWTLTMGTQTREQRKRRKRAIRRDVILIFLAVIVPVCAACLANCLAPAAL